MFDIAAIGELLIDFTPCGQDAAGDLCFARKPGGAPANVLVAAARLGARCAFIGKVGEDAFGHFLAQVLEEQHVDHSGLLFDANIPTTLAFVTLDERGDRSFTFYRKPGADTQLFCDEIPYPTLDRCRILHFGSVSLTDDPARSATLAAVQYARAAGKLISFDPNYRPFLWRDEQAAIAEIERALPLCDIVKVSEEELALLTGTTELARGAAKLFAYGPSLVLVSRGASGAFACTRHAAAEAPGFSVRTIDTNGAGDTFLGAVLTRLSATGRDELAALSEAELSSLLTVANAAGALTTTRSGAMPAMPTAEELSAFLAREAQ